MLNTFHLRTFIAVVDAGSYSAAAAALHMTQPAVSQQIHALEEQLGEIRLFRRVGKRMVPTHAGEELLAVARDLVQLAERAEQNILALKGQVAGRVVLGCTPSSGERLLPRLLAGYHSQYPAVSLEIAVAPADALLDALAERSVALVLLEEQQRRRGLELTPLGGELLALLAPVGHALLKQEQVPPGVLRELPLALPRPGSPMRRTVEEGLRRRGVAVVDLRPVLETDSVTALLQAARAGLGLAFVPRSCAPVRGEGVGTVDLAGLPIQQEWFLARARERSLPRAVQSLFDYLTGPQARAVFTRAGIQLTPG
ncbi:MAG TPA: LysR family transcriptional regulator [Chloroflexaceae bacterium]|nr:LysR family transcriptional regulator [Chloroflexaceae bacterium]